MKVEKYIHNPAEVLGISASATEKEIRLAYLQKIREHPPDRSPEQFEAIRDAYAMLRDPHKRIKATLLTARPEAPFTDLLSGISREKRFVGPDPWISAMKETPS